eukprot:7762615-Pyramimonas_sp.AAC.1
MSRQSSFATELRHQHRELVRFGAVVKELLSDTRYDSFTTSPNTMPRKLLLDRVSVIAPVWERQILSSLSSGIK